MKWRTTTFTGLFLRPWPHITALVLVAALQYLAFLNAHGESLDQRISRVSVGDYSAVVLQDRRWGFTGLAVDGRTSMWRAFAHTPNAPPSVLDSFPQADLDRYLTCVRHEVGWPWRWAYYTIRIRGSSADPYVLVRRGASALWVLERELHIEEEWRYVAAIATGVVGVRDGLEPSALEYEGLIGVPVLVKPWTIVGNYMSILTPIVALMASGRTLRSRWRHRNGRCRGCGYQLEPNAELCPECGKEFTT